MMSFKRPKTVYADEHVGGDRLVPDRNGKVALHHESGEELVYIFSLGQPRNMASLTLSHSTTTHNMAAKKKLLTQVEYDALAGSDEWRIIELGLDVVRSTPGVQRTADLLGVFGSGDANATKTLNGRVAVFGMDVIVFEHCPKVLRGEGHVNVYHYVVTRTGRPELPYCLHGPFTKEALQSHWPTDLDLAPYD